MSSYNDTVEQQKGKEVKKNDEYIVAIEDMGSEGEGVGKIDGYALFVKDTIKQHYRY